MKSRGKRKDNDGWVVGYYVCLNENSHRIYTGNAKTFDEDYFPEFYEIDPKTLGDFTGRYDRNHKEVYQGDVIRFFQSLGCSTRLRLVEYKDGRLEATQEDGCCAPLYSLDMSVFEVIGNIHETSPFPMQEFGETLYVSVPRVEVKG